MNWTTEEVSGGSRQEIDGEEKSLIHFLPQRKNPGIKPQLFQDLIRPRNRNSQTYELIQEEDKCPHSLGFCCTMLPPCGETLTRVSCFTSGGGLTFLADQIHLKSSEMLMLTHREGNLQGATYPAFCWLCCKPQNNS